MVKVVKYTNKPLRTKKNNIKINTNIIATTRKSTNTCILQLL